VKDVLVMDVLERQHRLRKPSKYLLFRDPLMVPPRSTDLLCQLTAFTKVHDQTQHASLTKAFTVAHHEGMLQRCEQSALLGCIFRLLFGRFTNVHNLANSLGAIGRLYEQSLREGAFPYLFHFPPSSRSQHILDVLTGIHH